MVFLGRKGKKAGMNSDAHPRKNGKKVNGALLSAKADEHIKMALAAIEEGRKDSIKTREALKKFMEVTDVHDRAISRKT